MVEQAVLSKVLKEAMKGGKYATGSKETIAAMKGTKAVICTRSIPAIIGAKLRDEAKKQDVPIVEVSFTSSQLARMIGKPFRISVLGLRSIGDGDLKQLTR